MANVFAITTVTEKLNAETGSATTVFTATNTTSRPLRGIAKTKSLGNTQASWIKIEGEAERDFPAGGTHQFTVSFNKPPGPPAAGQPAESFPFRFDVVSAANPDEDFTEGPIVTIEIPERKVDEKKGFPWWIVAAAAILLLVGAVVGWLLLRNGDVEVPDVVGKTFDEANQMLINSNLRIKEELQFAANREVDKILSQTPAANAKVGKDSVVVVNLPDKTTVPPLNGKCAVEAIELLVKSDLKPGDLVGDKSRIEKCERRVGSTTPPAKAPIAKGSPVTLNFPCNPAVEKCFKIPFDQIAPEILVRPDIMDKIKKLPTP